MSQDDKPWHAMGRFEVVTYWETSERFGITSTEAEERRRKVGLNVLPQPPKPSPLLQLLGQFANPLVGALLAAAVVSAVVAFTDPSHASASWLERFSDTIAILLIVIVNALLGFFQERKAEKTLDALQKMQVPMCKVVRGGAAQIIDAKVLVPGDLIELESGDAVPADARLVEGANVYVEEASLTGESTSVAKDHDRVLPVGAVVNDRRNMVFLGTSLSRGKARAIIVQTGEYTELGRIGKALESAEKQETPLERQLEVLGKRILFACLAISVFLFVLGMVLHTASWTVLLLTAVSLAVAAIPEGLPAITTITLALGMQRMAKRHALVRKLPAVETLGATTIICTDKTGTLTQNAMTVRRVVTSDGAYDVTGDGYRFVGTFSQDGKELAGLPGVVTRVLATGALCNGARVDDAADDISIVGDPTEAALVTLAGKAGIRREDIEQLADQTREIPFDSDRKRMSVALRFHDAQHMLYTKGSADVLLPLCTHRRTEQGLGPLDEAMRKAILRAAEEMASQALRVLLLAERQLPDALDVDEEVDLEQELVYLGLVGMIDPPRSEVKQAIAECHSAGVKVTMITGDHQLTAEAIARELGLWEPGSLAMNGEELDSTGEQQLLDVVDDVRVFARVTSEHKQKIVRALKKRGHVVAMTGDGVNDAPAIKEAQIGIAMGKGGTDVARQAADMVLADDNFATIVHAVREGRAIFRNIQKFIFFLNSSNAGLCVAVIVQSFIPTMRDALLTPLMLLWINLVTNGLPALALGIDPPEASQMKEKPRSPTEGIIATQDYLGMLVVGLIMGLAALAVYDAPRALPAVFGTGLGKSMDLQAGRTMAFCILALSPLFHAHNCRSAVASIFKVGVFSNRFLWAAIVLSALVHVSTIFVPALRPVFRTHDLTLPHWLLVLGLSALPVPVVELLKILRKPTVKAVEAVRASFAPPRAGA